MMRASYYLCRPCLAARVAKRDPDRSRALVRRFRAKNAAPRVYVVSNPAWPGAVKIGLTRINPQSRLSQMQTGDPHRAYKYEALVEVANADEAEAILHAALKPFHLKGEWFLESVEKAVALVETLAVSKPHH